MLADGVVLVAASVCGDAAHLCLNAVVLRGVPLARRSHPVNRRVVMMTEAHIDVAKELHTWFGTIVRLTEQSLFSMVPEGPHRRAVVLDVLVRNARVLAAGDVDHEGKLYSPLCFFLVAACRRLETPLGVGHWRAAVENVLRLREQIASTRAASAKVGLEIGSPAVLFKQQFDEAIIQAGLAGAPSYLDPENRAIAVGLAVNWGIRLLLAYALECEGLHAVTGRQDLAWIARKLGPPQSSTLGPVEESR